LAKALQEKANADKVAACACVGKDALPTIVENMDVLADSIFNKTADVGGLVKYRAASIKCHDQGLLFSAKAGKCHDATIIDCGNTVATKLGEGWAQPKCTGDTTLGGDPCTVACKEGYKPNSVKWTCGVDKLWSGPTLKCVAPACSSHPLVGKRGLTKGDCKASSEYGQTCTLGCDGDASRGSMKIECGLGSQWKGPEGICATGAVDCKKLPDGRHILSPGGKGSPSVQVNCVNGWMIIDPSIEPKGWANYFNGWVKYSAKGGGVYGPTKKSLLAHKTTSIVSWRGNDGWFKLPVKNYRTELSTSDDCKSCGGKDQLGKGYHMSGNFYGCKWLNLNCPMGDDMVCKKCMDGSNGGVTGGPCTHLPMPAGSHGSTYNFHAEKDCQMNWWHTAPSISGGGKFCLCYKPA